MSAHAYSTYIVASRSHTLYIGVTGNLRKRIFEHKWKEHDGFTERYNCDRLVWFEVYQEATQAIAREKQLIHWRRSKKITLIERTNPTWLDLSREWYEFEPADFKRATSQSVFEGGLLSSHENMKGNHGPLGFARETLLFNYCRINA